MIEMIDETIRTAAPELTAQTEGRMLGYGRFHYRYATGREGHTYVVSMMDGAQALSVYVMGSDGTSYLAEANAERLSTGASKVSVGKSCIRVKRLEHLDLTVLAELVRASVDQHAASLTG